MHELLLEKVYLAGWRLKHVFFRNDTCSVQSQPCCFRALHFTFFFGFVLSVVWPYVSVLEPQSPCYLLLLASRVAFPVQPSLT